MKSKLIIGLLLLGMTGQLWADDKVVRVVSSPWQPYFGEELAHYGMVGEIITAAFESSDFSIKFIQLPWTRALVWLESGKADAVASAYVTPERTKRFLVSKSYMNSPVVFFKKKENPIQWATLHDLLGVAIGVARDNSYSPAFDAADYLNKHTFSQETQLLKLLSVDRVKLVVLDRYVGLYLLANKLPGYVDKIDIMSGALAVNPLHMLFSRKSALGEAKMAAFDKGLLRIKASGELQRIIDKYELPMSAAE